MITIAPDIEARFRRAASDMNAAPALLLGDLLQAWLHARSVGDPRADVIGADSPATAVSFHLPPQIAARLKSRADAAGYSDVVGFLSAVAGNVLGPKINNRPLEETLNA